MPVHDIETSEDLKGHLAGSDKLAVIKFGADFCAPCKLIDPKYKACAETYGEKAIFLACDVEEGEDLADEFGVEQMPVIVFMKAGKGILETIQGAKDPDAIEKAILKHIE